MIEICNLRNERMRYVYDIRVDRKSILGNAFVLKDESERNKVCEKYKEYFYRQIKHNLAFANEVARLAKIHSNFGKLRLFCWCAPKQCHAETIKEFLERVYE